ncbi:lipase family protein [Undibacterium sp.]|uniref:lipase family protein n=1 Tax=Undibacterium sp. TaxID=1914977 RepID=UPI00272FA8AF|nr:lipase family protein [Undibacterium sp.]MDP1978285.1 lipase family protein [Undibacterium sp.]
MSTTICNPSSPNPGLAMTLAATAYCTDPVTTLNNLNNGWTAVWVATTDINGNIAFIAYNGSSQYVVAIRGSLLNFSWQAFDNWFVQDLNVYKQTAWIYPASDAQPMISQGSSDGLNDLSQLVSATGQTIYQYLAANAIGNDISIGVVGHSLGGNLATVFAPWLLYQLQQNKLTPPALFPVLTFAAPTAGNQAFAEAYDKSFPASWRYYNEIDLVPMASDSLRSAEQLYSPAPEASSIETTYGKVTVTLQKAIGLIADSIDISELHYGSYYAQTNQSNGSIALNTSKTLNPVDTSKPLIEQWFDQVASQHVQSTYLSFFGLSPVTCAST